MGRGLQTGADFQLNLMKRNAQIQLGGQRLFAVFVSSLVFFRAVLLIVAGFVFVTGHQEKCCQLLQCGGVNFKTAQVGRLLAVLQRMDLVEL